MNYFISEMQVDESQARTAGSKARDDVETILRKEGMSVISVATMQKNRKEKRGLIQKLKVHYDIFKEWKIKTQCLKEGDVLFVQFPCLEHTLCLPRLLKILHKRGVRTVLLLHDLELLRISKERNTKLKKKIRLRLEEFGCLRNGGNLIAHNPSMVDYLKSLGIPADKIISLGIFDYLIPDYSPQEFRDKDKVVIAGNLEKRKAGYLYELPDDVKFELYGVNYTGIQNKFITYHGSYPSNELPNILDGGFGLVWDGTTAKTCDGVYGNYLRINNPHKTSLYLASGLPVLIWKQAALADFITENHCGLVIDSLEEIPAFLQNLTSEDYGELKKSAERVGKWLREGKYTVSVINGVTNQSWLP